MKSFSFTKALTLGCLMVLALPVACGDDETNPPAKAGSDAGGEAGAGTGGSPTVEGGAGGAPATMLPPGISDMSKTEMCTDEPKCASAAVGPLFIDPCCAGDACGLSTAFLGLVGANFAEECQPRGQVGEVDESCPTTAPSAVPFPTGGTTIMVPIAGFVGCCRENGKCGVVVDDVVSSVAGKLATLGLGCVDAAPFFPGEAPASCGGDAGGAGGGGAGGAASAGAGAGGAAGGAGGNN
jgi:hypothetical protein